MELAKYRPKKTARKAAWAVVPVIVGESLAVLLPDADRGNCYAVGVVVQGVLMAVVNWWKNRDKG